MVVPALTVGEVTNVNARLSGLEKIVAPPQDALLGSNLVQNLVTVKSCRPYNCLGKWGCPCGLLAEKAGKKTTGIKISLYYP